MRLSQKLGALCAVAAILPLIVASVLVLYQTSRDSRARARERLQNNARLAEGLYEKRLAEMRSAAQRLADEVANRVLVSRENEPSEYQSAWARLQDMLPGAQNEFSLDFLIVADQSGRVIARHNDRPSAGESILGNDYKNPVAESVISEGTGSRIRPLASSVVEPREQLARLGLAQMAEVARIDSSLVEDSLMIEAAAPIFSAGRFVGVVLIGQMLNNFSTTRAGGGPLQSSIVGEARQIVYGGQAPESGALISLGDTIIASSVPAKGERDSGGRGALEGARRDPARTEEIIQSGGRDYAVSWESVKSLDGTEVAAIGCAIPASEIKAPVTVGILLIVIGVLAFLLAGAVGFLFGRFLGIRLEALTEAATRMSVGELSTPVKDQNGLAGNWIPPSLAEDEINRLAEQMDRTRDSFRQAIERLRRRG